MFYRIFRLLAAITLRMFFRRIEVQHPLAVASGPVLLVSNHCNGLVDPLLPLIVLRRRVALTGKSTLNKNPLLAFLNWGLGSICFHRPQDAGKGAHPRENVRSMQRCRQVLAQGGMVSVFPEGISHSDLKMRPFHSGAAHLALDFVRKDHNSGNLKIVPMGLLYTAKDQFRSDALIRFGPAIDVGQWVSQHPNATAKDLTMEIRLRIESLTISYANRREMLVVNCTKGIFAAPGQAPRRPGTTEPPVADSFAHLSRLQAGYRALYETHGSQIDALADQARDYRAELQHRGIDPANVLLPIQPLKAMLFLIRELELILIGAPLAIFGIINHLLPFLLVRTIARRLSVDKDHWATNIIYPSFIVFPFFYCVQIAAAWMLLPVLCAAVYTTALPYTGYYAVLYSERVYGAWRQARTWVYFVLHTRTRHSLIDRGRRILAGIDALQKHLKPERK